MATEQLANNAVTTLNGAIDGVVTSLVVTSASLFPTSGTFSVMVDSEIMLVTAVSGTTFTVTRASDGTSAAAHSNGATIAAILSKRSLLSLLSDRVLRDHFANLPAAATLGRLFLPDDAPVALRDNGSSWDVYGPLNQIVLPINGDFSWINQGLSTVDATRGFIALNAVASGSKNLRLRVKAAPGTPYTITALIKTSADPSDFWNAGLCFRESGTGKIATYEYDHVTNVQMAVAKNDNPTTFNSNYRVAAISDLPPLSDLWFRIADDGVSRICSFSADGYNFQVFHSIGRTDFLTADQVGFFANSQNSQPVTNSLYSWKEG